MGIDDVIERMTALAAELRRDGDARLAFHGTYLRTTEAVARALRDGAFADPEWVDRWDVAFAQLYLDALDAGRRGDPVPEPWAVAFAAAAAQPGLPAVRHVLLGMNAHINYDLPQALLAVISDAEFGDPQVRARREADHRRIDEVLAVRVGAEDAELQRIEPARTWQDRALQPLNRMATRRFLRESRAKVWANAAGAVQGPRGRPGQPTRAASPSWRSCAAAGWPTWCGPARCCSGWRPAASGSAWPGAASGRPAAAGARRPPGPHGGRHPAVPRRPARSRCGPSTRSRSATWRPSCG